MNTTIATISHQFQQNTNHPTFCVQTQIYQDFGVFSRVENPWMEGRRITDNNRIKDKLWALELTSCEPELQLNEWSDVKEASDGTGQQLHWWRSQCNVRTVIQSFMLLDCTLDNTSLPRGFGWELTWCHVGLRETHHAAIMELRLVVHYFNVKVPFLTKAKSAGPFYPDSINYQVAESTVFKLVLPTRAKIGRQESHRPGTSGGNHVATERNSETIDIDPSITIKSFATFAEVVNPWMKVRNSFDPAYVEEPLSAIPKMFVALNMGTIFSRWIVLEMGYLFDVALDRYETSMGFWQMVGSGRVLAVGLNGWLGQVLNENMWTKSYKSCFFPRNAPSRA
ncbi:hypothetical protein BJ165DRAFT_1403247 [Panaeolus papilionaceus]|nr:hypothetical protein BJ165DRAFT_1403247 [Panaeolus papilionaceus]